MITRNTLDRICRIEHLEQTTNSSGELTEGPPVVYLAFVPCSIQILSPAAREIASREGLAATHALTLNGHHPLTPHHQIVVNEERYRPTRPARHPKGRTTFTVVELERIEG